MRDRRGGEVALEQARHGDVLGEDQHRAVLGEDRVEQLVEQVELPGAAAPAGRAGLAQVVRRVVADLLERGEQLEHQPAAGVLVGALDPLHRLADDRLVERGLLAGQPTVVGLGLGGSSGAMPGSDLRRRSRNGSTSWANRRAPPGRPALDRRGPDLAEGVRRAEQPGRGPVEDRPQLGEVVLHRRAGQRDPARDPMVRRLARGRGGGFLTCCASSATTRSHGDRRRSVGARRAASCRRW